MENTEERSGLYFHILEREEVGNFSDSVLETFSLLLKIYCAIDSFNSEKLRS